MWQPSEDNVDQPSQATPAPTAEPPASSPVRAAKPSVPNTRVGNVSAMLRVLGPLNDSSANRAHERRRVLAELCKFLGTEIVGTANGAGPGSAGTRQGRQTATAEPAGAGTSGGDANEIPCPVMLPRRLEQTLQCLLAGDSEKQVAKKLSLSRHTVHVYVKALYRKFEVSSRAELLARHLRR